MSSSFLFNRLLPTLAVLALLAAALLLVTDIQSDSAQVTVLNLWILGLALSALLFLLAAIAARLIRLVKELRTSAPGARLTRRLMIIFLLLTLPPVLIVYFFSLEFLNETIDGWLDVGQEQALADSLELGRLFLDLRTLEAQREVLALSDDFSVLARQGDDADWFPELIKHVSNSGPVELSIIDTGGSVIATANIRGTTLQADRPRDFTLLQILENGSYAAAEPVNQPDADGDKPELSGEFPAGGENLKIRAAVVLPNEDASQSTRILHAIYYLPKSFTDLAGNIESAVYRNQTVTYLRDSLKISFVIILSLVLLLSMLLAILAALSAAQRLVQPLTQLARATDEIAGGHYHQELSIRENDELGFLVQSFNSMSVELDHSRQNLEAQRLYLETVLGRLSAGVLSVNSEGELITSNASASDILGFELKPWHGRSLQQLITGNDRLAIFFQRIYERRNQALEWREEIKLPGTKPLVLVCRGSQLPKLDQSGSGQNGSAQVRSGQAGSGQVIVFDDVTVLTEAQREAAWAEVARRLAHEVKNPLTPIRLSAERLGMKLSSVLDDDGRELLEKSTRTIVNQVEALQAMVNAFADYAQDSKQDREELDLHELISDVVTLYANTSDRQHIELRLQADNADIQGNPGRLRQVLHNLIRNAMEACAAASNEPALHIYTSSSQLNEQAGVQLDIIDNGSGVDAELLPDIFKPYVTSKAASAASSKTAGLGLAIVKRIIEEHSGSISMRNNEQGGAAVCIWLPCA